MKDFTSAINSNVNSLAEKKYIERCDDRKIKIIPYHVTVELCIIIGVFNC